MGQGYLKMESLKILEQSPRDRLGTLISGNIPIQKKFATYSRRSKRLKYKEKGLLCLLYFKLRHRQTIRHQFHLYSHNMQSLIIV